MTKNKKYKNKNLLFVTFSLVVCVIIASLVILLLTRRYNSENISNKQALVNYVPNFNSLTLEDLPNFSDIREVYEYNGNLIVVGYNKVAEYDKENDKFVRISDPKVLDCVNDSAKIDDDLYISCNSHYPNDLYSPETKTIVSSAIYKINLKTGKIVNKYLGKEISIDPEILANNGFAYKTKGARSNLTLGSKDKTLYLSSWDGIEKMDTVSGKITIYSLPGEIKPGDELIGTHLYPMTNWFEMNPPIKRTEFKSIPPLVNDIYYILANDGLYTLSKGKFPEILISSQIDGDINNRAISQDGQYLVFVGPAYNMGATIGIYAYLIDVTNSKVINLSNITINGVNKPAEKISAELENGSFEEQDGLFLLKDKKTDSLLLSIDLKKQKLNIAK